MLISTRQERRSFSKNSDRIIPLGQYICPCGELETSLIFYLTQQPSNNPAPTLNKNRSRF